MKIVYLLNLDQPSVNNLVFAYLFTGFNIFKHAK